MTSYRLPGIGLLLLLLAACQSGPPATLEERMGAYQWRAVSQADAFFLMPAKAEDLLVGTGQKSWDNAIEQRSTLRNDSVIPGESYLALRFIARPMDVTELFSLGQSLSPTRYTDRSVPRRLREEFPGLAMELVREARINRYGPYYYATAQHGDQRCVFAWQVLDQAGSSLPPYLRRLEMEFRHCGGDDVGVDSLLLPFDHGVVRPDTGVLPLGGLSMSMTTPSAAGSRGAAAPSAPAQPAGTFPRPAATSQPASAPAPSTAAPAPRRLVNGAPAPSSGASAQGSSGFPMPGGH